MGVQKKFIACYLVADGYYYRSKFCDAVRALNLEFISKLRIDANLRYLYTGEQKKLAANVSH